jgi:hypothetical protein
LRLTQQTGPYLQEKERYCCLSFFFQTPLLSRYHHDLIKKLAALKRREIVKKADPIVFTSQGDDWQFTDMHMYVCMYFRDISVVISKNDTLTNMICTLENTILATITTSAVIEAVPLD